MDNGFIYKPQDIRDYPVCMAYEDDESIEIPKSYTTTFQPPYAKQVCGNCVAQTLANILEVMYYNMTGRHEDFSVGFIYGNRTDDQSQTEGMTGYMACGNLCKDGDVKSEVFDNPGSAPSIIDIVTKFKESYPDWRENSYIPKMYIRTTDADEVKKFILKYNIPVMGIVHTKNIGGCVGNYLHAMALYGWNEDIALFQNSWGENHRKKNPEIAFEKCEEFWLILPFEIANFNDISTEHWAYKDVLNCVEKNILLGYPDNTFAPEKELSRAELAVIIYRMLKGENAV